MSDFGTDTTHALHAPAPTDALHGPDARRPGRAKTYDPAAATTGRMDLDPDPWWTYRAQPDHRSDHDLGVVDGDTLDLVLDQGLDSFGAARVRLGGVDTAEVYGVSHDSEEYETGRTHSRYVAGWMAEAKADHEGGWPLVVRTARDESGKYGRLVADVTRRVDGANLADDLVAEFPSVATD